MRKAAGNVVTFLRRKQAGQVVSIPMRKSAGNAVSFLLIILAPTSKGFRSHGLIVEIETEGFLLGLESWAKIA